MSVPTFDEDLAALHAIVSRRGGVASIIRENDKAMAAVVAGDTFTVSMAVMCVQARVLSILQRDAEKAAIVEAQEAPP